MAASINDKFTKTFNSGNPNVATVTNSRTALATTLNCDNLAGWPTDTAVHFSTYRIDVSNQVVPGSQTDWKGIVTGNDIGSLTRLAGAADSGNDIGDIVEMNPTGSWANDLAEGLAVKHEADGSFKAGAVDTPDIADKAIEEAKIDDGAVSTRTLAQSAVTPDKLALGGLEDVVYTSQSTSSTSYTNLGTVGASVTVDIGVNGLAIVMFSAGVNIATSGGFGYTSFDLSGANTASAGVYEHITQVRANATNDTAQGTFLLTGLNPGPTTFTMKYKVLNSSVSWSNRRIAVVPL